MVAKGAFLAAIDPLLGRREFARTSYGTALSIKYNPRKHDAADAVLADEFCAWKYEVKNRVFWLVKKGQNVVEPAEPMLVDGHIYVMEEVSSAGYAFTVSQTNGNLQDLTWPITLEQEIFKCEDPAVCLQDGLE